MTPAGAVQVCGPPVYPKARVTDCAGGAGCAVGEGPGVGVAGRAASTSISAAPLAWIRSPVLSPSCVQGMAGAP